MVQHHCRFLCFSFTINRINWFKISTKPSDKNIPNIYQVFRMYQIKKLYTKYFENIYENITGVYIPVGNTAANRFEAVLCGYWNVIIRSAPKNFNSIRIRSWSENFAQNIIRSRSEYAKPSSYQIEMARAANSPVFGLSATVLKQSASNFFSDDVTPGRYSLLAKNFCFLQSFII